MKKLITKLLVLICILSEVCFISQAQQIIDSTQHVKISSTNKKEQLEFSHPLITESISPDNKIRFTYFNTKVNDSLSSQTCDLELEYAPVPFFSLHLDVPYQVLKPGTSTESNLDNIEFTLKFANFALAEHSILFGYGIGLGFPTGNDIKGIGSNHILNVEPFLNGGYKWRRWEWIAYFTLNVPTHQRMDEMMQSGLDSRITALYHLNSYFQLLGEFGNERYVSHQSGWNKNYELLEGIKYLPFGHKPWILALGVNEPIAQNEVLKFQWLFSLFYHFRD